MRRWRILGWTVGALLAVLVVLFAGLQTTPGKTLLAGMVSSKQLKVSGLTGFFPTNLNAAHIELSDDDGPWLEITGARLNWSLRSLFTGRLRVEALSADRIDLARAPKPSAKEKPASADSGGGFSLPMGVDLASFAVPDLHLGAALAGGVASRWKLQGSGLLAADRSESHLAFEATRLDGPSGHVRANLAFALDRFHIDGAISGEEAGNGVIAALLGRPDLDRVAFKLAAKGDQSEGTMTLAIGAGNAVTGDGTVLWHRDGGATELSVHLSAQAPGLPDSPIARLLRTPATVDAKATLNGAGVWSLTAASAAVGPAHLVATGAYDSERDALDLDALLQAEEPGPFAGLSGATWRNLRLNVKVTGVGVQAQNRGSGTLSGSADDVALAGAPALPPGHIDISARFGLAPGGRLVVEALDLGTPLARVKASGNWGLQAQEGDGRLTLSFADLAAFSPLAQTQLQGNGELALDLHVREPGSRVSWQGRFADLGSPGVPADLTRSPLTLTGGATVRSDGSWQVDGAQFASDALSLGLTGHGWLRGDQADRGEINLGAALPHLSALAPDVGGAARARAKLTLKKGGGDVKASLDIDGLSRGGIASHHLGLAVDGTLQDAAAHGSLRVDGDLANQAVALAGRFARNADGSTTVPSAEGHWASASLHVGGLEIKPSGMTGSGHLRIGRLEDLAPLVGSPLAGAIDVDLATEPDAAGKLRLAFKGDQLRSGGTGVGSLVLDATIADPLGDSTTDAAIRAERLVGLAGFGQAKATLKGDRHAFDLALNAGGESSVTLAAKVEPGDSETRNDTRVTLQRFEGRQQGIALALAAPTRLTIAGARVVIAPSNLRLGGGQVRLGGTVDPAATDLTVDVTGLPLGMVDTLAPGTGLDGTLQLSVHATGALANPRLQATYAANGVRLRRPETALLPALALQGTASLANQQATFDASLGAGGGTRLALKGKAGLPQGRAPLNATVALSGTMDLAPFAPALGDSLRNLAGSVRPDLTIDLAGKAVTGRGTISLGGGAVTVPATGLRLTNGQANFVLQGNTLQLQRLTFQTARNGELSASGTIRLDPAAGLPVDLTVTTRQALVANRPDLLASVSSDLKVSGNMKEGFDVRGPVTIDRAEIGIGLTSAGNYPVLPVREINGRMPVDPAIAPPPPAAAGSSGAPIRLALDIKAPQSVFVRGRGLNAEVGGQFTVSGDPAKPAVLGSLKLRRGTFDLVGHRLDFTRGNISLMSATTIDPLLDFAATTSVQSTTIEVDITGTARAPKFSLTSSPALPQDEAMAMLLFGKPSSSLSPVEILTAAQAVSELASGAPVGSGVLGRLRGGLGLDQLSVQSSSSSSSSSAPSPSLTGGRYVAPGVYVGAEQGTTGSSSRGIVEIEVFRHTKIEGAVGADSNDRIGAKMEWDY
jgi:translocation and assembly module TamB